MGVRYSSIFYCLIKNCIEVSDDDDDNDNSKNNIFLYNNKYDSVFENIEDNNLNEICFKYNYIIENTPYGNVIMKYDDQNNIFCYYSDRQLVNTVLETISKKFIVIYKCKNIYHKIIEEEEQEEEERKEQEKKKEELLNVYGKFAKKNNKERPIIQSNINSYKYLGKISDFSPLQIIPLQSKKKNISYLDFIKN